MEPESSIKNIISIGCLIDNRIPGIESIANQSGSLKFISFISGRQTYAQPGFFYVKLIGIRQDTCGLIQRAQIIGKNHGSQAYFITDHTIVSSRKRLGIAWEGIPTADIIEHNDLPVDPCCTRIDQMVVDLIMLV